MDHHLAVIHRPYILKILAGHKRIECRLLRRRSAPYMKVAIGDCVWFKAPSAAIIGCATVSRVRWMTIQSSDQVRTIQKKYNRHIDGDERFWTERLDCRYAGLIWLANPRPCPPIRIAKRDQRSWVVLPGRPFDEMQL